jgi:hypothetical protein
VAAKKKKQKPFWERGYNGHVYWFGKKKLGKVTLHDANAKHKYTWEAAGREGAATTSSRRSRRSNCRSRWPTSS